MKWRQACQYPPEQISQDLHEWYASPVGQLVLDGLKQQLAQLLPKLFGYYAVQIGSVDSEQGLLGASPVQYHLRMDSGSQLADVRARATDLPFQADSVDLVLLLHALEFSNDPHQILREVDRILIPEGHVISVGFNPFSFYGLWKSVRRWDRRAPWCGRFYSCARLKDWLSLLGFDALETRRLGFCPPFQQAGVQQKLAFMETALQRVLPASGGLQIVLAQKKVATLTPLKTNWQPRRRLVSGNLTEPSARKIARNITKGVAREMTDG